MPLTGTTHFQCTNFKVEDIAGVRGEFTIQPPPLDDAVLLTAPTEDGVIVVSVNNVFANAAGNVNVAAGGGGGILTFDTNTINLTGNGALGTELTADLIISPNSYNTLEAFANGVYTTPMYVRTKAQADTAITGSTLIPGQEYKITGVHTSLYGGTDVILKASTPNSFELAGHGIFYNPIYNHALVDHKIWSNRSTFTATPVSGVFNNSEAITNDLGGTGTLFTSLEANKFIVTAGTWTGATSITGTVTGATATITGITLKAFAIGDKTIWGGYVWSNVNGLVGASTTTLALNTEWTVVPYNTTDYALTYDFIFFDYINNLVVRRSDNNGNTVVSTFDDNTLWASKSFIGNPISVFQWGNPFITTTAKGTGNNEIINGYADCVNYSGSFSNNKLSNRGIIQGNIVSGSQFNLNIVHTRGEVRFNTMNNAFLYENKVNGGSFGGLSAMSSNNMHNGYIINNTVQNTSTISSNTIRNNSFIYNNVLSLNCAINSNIFTGQQNIIYENIMNYTSTINSNTLIDRGIILRNDMQNTSKINSNSFTGTNLLGGEAFISTNHMIYGEINNNTCVNTGNRNNICNNTLWGDNQLDIQIRQSTISGCTLNGVGHVFIRDCFLRIAQMNNISTNNFTVRNIKIDDYVWDWGLVNMTQNVQNLVIDPSEIKYVFSIAFTGAAGAGAVGAVTIPLLQAQTGYYITETLVDVGAGLTGAGAKINLGIAVDSTTSALNDTTGDVATLNANISGVARISPSDYYKATATRNLVMEVKTAAITAGTVGIIVKLNKSI